MFNVKNPLSVKTNLEEMEAELQQENPDVERLTKIRNTVVAKRAARGLLVASAVITAVVVVAKSVNTDDEDETEE